jgi:hypothetical protein
MSKHLPLKTGAWQEVLERRAIVDVLEADLRGEEDERLPERHSDLPAHHVEVVGGCGDVAHDPVASAQLFHCKKIIRNL